MNLDVPPNYCLAQEEHESARTGCWREAREGEEKREKERKAEWDRECSSENAAEDGRKGRGKCPTTTAASAWTGTRLKTRQLVTSSGSCLLLGSPT